jgi:hypothetical protein
LCAWVRGRDGSGAVSMLLSRLTAGGAGFSVDEGVEEATEVTEVTEPQQQRHTGQIPGLSAIASSTMDGSAAAAVAAGAVAQPGGSKQQQQQHHHSRPTHHQQSPTVLAQLPLALHWVLTCGLRQIEGRAVTGSLVTALSKLSLRVARCAEVAGLPWAAAEALSVADVLGDPCGAGPGVLGIVLGLMWHARLAAAVLALQLAPGSTTGGTSAVQLAPGSTTGSTRAVQQQAQMLQGPTADAGSLGVGAADVAYWQAAVAEHLPLLQRLGLQVEPEAAAVALARHAAAQRPLIALPAAPPGLHWCSIPQQHSNSSSSSIGAKPGAGGTAAAAASNPAAAMGPDAVLAICLSRTSSIQQGAQSPREAMSSNISRAASLVQPSPPASKPQPTPTAAAAAKAAAVGSGGTGQARPRATGSTGGSSKQQQQQQQQQQHCVLGLSWELARLEGDKLRAVAPCVGSQYSCMVLHAAKHPAAAAVSPRQQQQQQQQRQPGMHQPGSAAAAGRPRPLVFASKQAGILPGELCAPANLLSHLNATISLSPQRRRQQQQVALSPPLPAAAAVASTGQLPGTAVPPAAAAGYNTGSSSLSGFMSQMLEQLRWPQDPWVVGEFPNRRSHSFGSAGMGHVQAAALAAHPTRPLYVSGSSTGRIYLWQFGEAMCKAAYVPSTSTQVRRACNVIWRVQPTCCLTAESAD